MELPNDILLLLFAASAVSEEGRVVGVSTGGCTAPGGATPGDAVTPQERLSTRVEIARCRLPAEAESAFRASTLGNPIPTSFSTLVEATEAFGRLEPPPPPCGLAP